MKAKPLLTFLGGAAIGLSVFALTASAQGDRTTLSERMSQRFGIDKTQVEEVMKEHRVERHEEMEQRFKDRLDQAVKDGKLTAEQKDKLLAKHEEVEKQMEALRDKVQNMSAEERQDYRDEHRAERKKIHDDFRAWAEDNGIELKNIIGGMGPQGNGGRMHGWR